MIIYKDLFLLWNMKSEYENTIIKKAKCQRIDAFELVLEKTLESPLTARRSNQSILKKINPEYSLEGLVLKLKLQYWPPEAKSWLLGKDPEAGEDWGREEKGDRRQYGWMASPTQWAWVWADSGKQWRKGKPGVLQSAGLQSRTQLSDCTTTSLLKDEIPPLNYMTY